MSYCTESREDTVAVLAPHKAKKKVSDIVEQSGMHERTVQCLIKRFSNAKHAFLPETKPGLGRPNLISQTTKVVINRQVNNNPRLTASELKKNNRFILEHVRVSLDAWPGLVPG